MSRKGVVMKKVLAVVAGVLAAGFLLATAMAGGTAPTEQGAEKSAVSQQQLDWAAKRQKARENRDAMMKEREITIKAADEKDRKEAEKKKKQEKAVQ